jgi:hypothetical protein
VKFKEFHEVDICKPEAVLAIASFFCPKKVLFLPHLKWVYSLSGDTYDSNYSCWIGCYLIWMPQLSGMSKCNS